MGFVNLHVHSHFSLLDGLSKGDQIARRCADMGHSACALTDHGSISGAVNFMTACQKAKVKPILGCEMYVTQDLATIKDKTNNVGHQVVLAKNIKGWYKLIELISRSNDKDVFYYKPRVDTQILSQIATNDLISFSGHTGSTLHNLLSSLTDAENYIRLMKDIFGPDNFFIEIQMIENTNAEILRSLAQKTNTKCIATGDSHYPTKESHTDHSVLLCSSLGLTIPDVRKKLKTGQSVPLSGFFVNNQFYLPDENDVIQWGNTPEEIENTVLLADLCENYDVTGPPKLPPFPCPNNMNENSYLRQLCQEGWRARQQNWDQTYVDRIRMELKVIEEAKLAGYFLIVQDYVNWSKNQGWLIGAGRGSAAGCLTSYLIGITNIDPIKHGLLFERFYNPGRNTATRVSYPDIDVDFPMYKRPLVIEYVRNKYGRDYVCQMATFGRMQGKGALKEVLRINGACDAATMNLITKEIPDENAINDQLEESDETSILRWMLINEPKELSNWVHMNDDETLAGDYAPFFEQAIRLEGTYKSQGRHAAGLVISGEKLDKICPMIYDRGSEEKIAGMYMGDLEAIGITKFDFLNVAVLDKLMATNSLLKHGRIIV
jgi:DNA polymerase-3 subunit alpha